MARRRKLEAPTAEDLSRLEEEFRRETPMKGAMAPIAQVAADAAAQTPVVDAETREKIAKDAVDATALRDALEKGLVMIEVPLEEIDMDDMIRDRVSIDETELQELKTSILANGLRLPVELYKLSEQRDGKTYGVVSGFRRVLAVRALNEETGDAQYTVVKALIKPVESVPDAFVAMVEENEIRSQLSHFERGRIAVVSTQNGAFETIEDAVNKLFAAASKAKRSKVRSFAHVFEELGDLMRFADQLTEKQGLRIASALRLGHAQELREMLAREEMEAADAEWEAIAPILEVAENGPKDVKRGGRPRTAASKETGSANWRQLRNGKPVSVFADRDEQGYVLRLEGQGANDLLLDAVKAELEKLLKD